MDRAAPSTPLTPRSRGSLPGRAATFALVLIAWLAAVVSSVRAQSDTTAPTLTALAIGPAVIDTSAGTGTLTFTWAATDDLAGVASVSVTVCPPGPLSCWHRVDGHAYASPPSTSAAGSGTITIPQFRPGTWHVSSIVVRDAANNGRRIVQGGPEFAALGIPPAFSVTGVADASAPSLTSFAISPMIVDTTGGDAAVTLDWTAADDLAGVGFVRILAEHETNSCGCVANVGFSICSFPGAGESQSHAQYVTPPVPAAAGSGVIVIPRGARPGTWNLKVGVMDAAFNATCVSGSDLAMLGGASLTVVGLVDTTPPVLTSFAFHPGMIDTTAHEATLTFTYQAADDSAGVAHVSVGACPVSGGGCFEDTVHVIPASPGAAGSGSITIPRFAQSGPWSVRVLVIDAVGQRRSYEPVDLTALGFPATLTNQTVCGDGIIGAGEGCDDDNTLAGDGCSGTCTLELGASCRGEPSVCTAPCGDGLLAPGEECDDGGGNGAPVSCCTTGCQLRAAGSACDDGDVCTANDQCWAGTCAGFPDLPVTYTVNSTADAPDGVPGNAVCETAPGNGICTLRAALQEAGRQHSSLPCGAHVALPAGVYQVTIPPSTYYYQDGSGPLPMKAQTVSPGGHMTLTGAGRDTTIIDAGNAMRAMDVWGTTASIRGVTVRHGSAAALPETYFHGAEGGGLLHLDGRLVLMDSALVENTGVFGGGLSTTSGDVVVVDTIVVDNTATTGAALYAGCANVNEPASTLAVSGLTAHGNVGGRTVTATASFPSCVATATIANSALHDNLTTSGPVVAANTARAVVVNTTVTDNDGPSCAVAIAEESQALVTVNNATVTHNRGGLDVSGSGTLAVSNVIVAANVEGTCPCGAGMVGALTSRGHNLFDDVAGCQVGGDATGNQLGIDPIVADLGADGSEPPTRALSPASPAIDAGSPAVPGSGPGACAHTDQRGVARPQLAACDIGAYEAASTAATVHPGTDVTVEAAGGVSVTFATVSSPGSLTVVRSATGPPLAPNFNLGNEPTQYLEISTTAAYTGPLTVCLRYDPAAFGIESAIQVLHFEGGQWVALPVVSRDLVNHELCVGTMSLSPFVQVMHASACPSGTPPPWTDVDGDGWCDAVDPCVGGAAPGSRAKVTIKSVLPPAGDDTLLLKGEAVLPAVSGLDPERDGVRVVLVGARGGIVLDTVVPPGTYDSGSKTGWRSNSKRTAWTYKGSGVTTAGVSSVRVTKSARAPGGIAFTVKGKNGTYAVGEEDLPLGALLVLAPPVALDGRCVTSAFGATPPDRPSCALVGASVKCQ